LYPNCDPWPMSRQEILAKIESKILAVKHLGRSVIIGIDGVDLSGKTTFTSDLAKVLRRDKEKVVLIHEDDFLNSTETRYQRGEWSIIGFYKDFFDFRALHRNILLPVRAAKPVAYALQSYASHRSNDHSIRYTIGLQDLVLVEGLFLLRKEFHGCFDLTIRLKIPFDLVLKRALIRDVPDLGSYEYVRRHYEMQVLPAQSLYERLVDPDNIADIVIENSNTQVPIILKGYRR
jgi:uridine kinase